MNVADFISLNSILLKCYIQTVFNNVKTNQASRKHSELDYLSSCGFHVWITP